MNFEEFTQLATDRLIGCLDPKQKLPYQDGFKYQLPENHATYCPELVGVVFSHHFFISRGDGWLFIRRGYAWDGLTGALDTSRSLRPSLYHDVVCQAVNAGLTPFETRALGDLIFARVMREKNEWTLMRWWRYAAVNVYGRLFGRNNQDKPVRWAP